MLHLGMFLAHGFVMTGGVGMHSSAGICELADAIALQILWAIGRTETCRKIRTIQRDRKSTQLWYWAVVPDDVR